MITSLSRSWIRKSYAFCWNIHVYLRSFMLTYEVAVVDSTQPNQSRYESLRITAKASATHIHAAILCQIAVLGRYRHRSARSGRVVHATKALGYSGLQSI